jgi:hypothetical protein
MSRRRVRRRRDAETADGPALRLDDDLAAIHARQGAEGRRTTELLQAARDRHRLTPWTASPRPSTSPFDPLEP